MWAKRHPEKAQEIAEQSTRWVYDFDLWFHPQAVRDEEEVMRIIIHCYQQFVLRAKPIIKWSDLYKIVATKCQLWYDWFAEDWLRAGEGAFWVAVCYSYLGSGPASRTFLSAGKSTNTSFLFTSTSYLHFMFYL